MNNYGMNVYAEDEDQAELEEMEELGDKMIHLPSEALPRYRPGQLLPYAVTLYNHVGGKFLLDSLKGFEELIESLGKDIHNEDTFGQTKPKPREDPIVQRLLLIHSEL